MNKAILIGSVMCVFGLMVSCTTTSRKAKELTAKGYIVCEQENGLWYYNADSVFYYDAATNTSNCILHMRQEIEELYYTWMETDENGYPNFHMTLGNATEDVKFNYKWFMPEENKEEDTNGFVGIKFNEDKGFVFYTIDGDSDYEGLYILYGANSHRVVVLSGSSIDITSNDTIISTSFRGTIPAPKSLDKELIETFNCMNAYWLSVDFNYNGDVVKESDTIEMEQLGIRIPVSSIGTSKLNSVIYEIKKKVEIEHLFYAISHAYDVNTLNNLFRNPNVAKNEAIEKRIYVMGTITEGDLFIGPNSYYDAMKAWGHEFMNDVKLYRMETGNKGLWVDGHVDLFAKDPNFDTIHLPAFVIFSGVVTSASSYDHISMRDCKMESVLRTPSYSMTIPLLKYKNVKTGEVIELWDESYRLFSLEENDDWEWVSTSIVDMYDYITGNDKSGN